MALRIGRALLLSWVAFTVLWIGVCGLVMRPDRPAAVVINYYRQVESSTQSGSEAQGLILPARNIDAAKEDLWFFAVLVLAPPVLVWLMSRGALWAAGASARD